MKIDAKNNLKWGGKFSHVPQNHHSQRMCTKVVDHNGHIKFELTTTNPSHLPTAHIVPDENDGWKRLMQGIILWLFFSAVSRLSLGIQNLKITWDYSRMTAKYSLCWLCALCTVGRWQRLIVIKLNLIWPFFIFLTFMNILDVQNSVFYEWFLQINWIKPSVGITKYSKCMGSCVTCDITLPQTVWMVCPCWDKQLFFLGKYM